MENILAGVPVAEKIYEGAYSRAESLKTRGITPKMLILRLGDRPDDISYEKSIIKNCEKAGICAVTDALPSDTQAEVFIKRIKAANDDNSIHSVMIMRPLPRNIDEAEAQAALDPLKDPDCFTEANLSKVFIGGASVFPCTPSAVIKLLTHYEIPLIGKRVVVAGRSAVVGKPLSFMLLNENATVTVCHSKTENIQFHTKNADIVVAAIGKPRFFGMDYFTENSIVIDVGVNYEPNECKMCGDVDFDGIKGFVTAVTPPRGGVGAVTTAVLLENAVRLCEIQNSK